MCGFFFRQQESTQVIRLVKTVQVQIDVDTPLIIWSEPLRREALNETFFYQIFSNFFRFLKFFFTFFFLSYSESADTLHFLQMTPVFDDENSLDLDDGLASTRDFDTGIMGWTLFSYLMEHQLAGEPVYYSGGEEDWWADASVWKKRKMSSSSNKFPKIHHLLCGMGALGGVLVRCLDCLATEPDTCLGMELDRMTADWESQVAEVERLESDLADAGDKVEG